MNVVDRDSFTCVAQGIWLGEGHPRPGKDLDVQDLKVLKG